MEFYGVEVPPGNPTTCSPGYGMYLHISQAALGDSKVKNGKGPERVVLKVSVEPANDIVLGTLSEGKCDQMHLDLVFDRDFTISHNSKYSSVYICGYRTEAPDEEEDDGDESEDEEEEEKDAPIPAAVPIEGNGAPAVKRSKAVKSDDLAKTLGKVTDKAANTVSNAIAKAVEKRNAKKPVVDSDEEDESDEEAVLGPFVSEFASESDDDEFDADDDSGEDDEDDDDDEEDEDEDDEDESEESEEEELSTPEVKTGKKRAAAVPVKVADKKAKTEASPKPGQVSVNGKKGKKVAQVTPVIKEADLKNPSDKGLKPAKAPKGTPAAPPTTPVSVKKIGDHKCASCDRAFTTESALIQHTAAKHK